MSDRAEAGSPRPWDLPAIESRSGGGERLTAGKLEAIQKEAYEEAWRQGHAEGLAAGRDAAAARVARLDELLKALTSPFEELDDSIEKQLVELAMAVAQQLFRREIRTEPAHVVGVVREAIGLLPVASRNVQVHLHPDDAALVRELLAPADGEPAWTLVEDPLLARGGCRVTTENSQIDATAEARLKAVISAVAGDERQ
ncbi:MAG: flagellar assembly protein FliH [Woeseiaceae bacterium]|nr:flagellar assembly protein FliH [Woeseiaceae bacterium]